MSSRRITQTFMQNGPAKPIPSVPFYNTAADLEKNLGFRTGARRLAVSVNPRN